MNFNRRLIIKSALSVAIVAGFYGIYRVTQKKTDGFVDKLIPYIKPNSRWTSRELSEFLENLSNSDQNLIMTSLDMEQNTKYDVNSIKKKIIWHASNIATYPFKNKQNFDYHEDIMIWLAEAYGVKDRYIKSGSTFVLERKILDSIFIQIWDKLPPKERHKMLNELDKTNDIEDKAGIALASGAVALTALSATVYFAGFAFYSTMSSIIFASAGFFGLTLPFVAYSGAASTVALLSGPVGWAILGLATLGSVVFMGRANHAKTAAFITQLHLIKVRSLKDSNQLDSVLRELGLN